LSEPIEEISLEDIPQRADKPFRPQRLDQSRGAEGQIEFRLSPFDPLDQFITASIMQDLDLDDGVSLLESGNLFLQPLFLGRVKAFPQHQVRGFWRGRGPHRGDLRRRLDRGRGYR